MVTLVVKLSRHPRRPGLLRHRDERSVTASPFESALTNRDASNLFRMFIYGNCRVSLASCALLSLFASRVFHNSFPIINLHTFSQKCRASPAPAPQFLKCYFNSAHLGSPCSPRASREPRQGALASNSALLSSRSIAPRKRRAILD